MFVLKCPDEFHYEGDRPNWRIALESGKPKVIRGYHVHDGLEGENITTDATYTEISDQPPVVAPPGNPHALAAEPGPENLLMAAMKKMNEGVLEVNGTASSTKTVKVAWTPFREDFDLTMEPEAGRRHRRLHCD